MKVLIMEVPLFKINDNNNLRFLNEEEARNTLASFVDYLCTENGPDCISHDQVRVRIADATPKLEEDTYLGVPIITDFIIED